MKSNINFVKNFLNSHYKHNKAAVHRDEVIRVQNVGDGGIMSVSQDGLMCFWKGNTMQLEKSVRLGMLDDKRKSLISLEPVFLV